MNIVKNTIAGIAVLALSSTAAHATLMFSIDDTNDASAATIVEDNGAGDNFATTSGFLDFNGAVGSWVINDVTAISNPWLGSDQLDVIHLDSLNVSSGSGGNLTIMLTQTDLMKTTAPFLASFGGSSGGMISYQLYADATNSAFGTGILLYDSSIDMTGAFADNFGGDFSLGSIYSMTMVVSISHNGGTATSFNYEVSIPEPASLALLGGGLLLVGFANNRRRRKAV